MKLIHRVLTTRVLIPLFTFTLGALLTNIFTTLSCYSHVSYDVKQPHRATKSDLTECFLVILILSAPNNVNRRRAIRESWLSLRLDRNSSLNQYVYVPSYDDSGWLIPETIEEQMRSLESHKLWLSKKQNTGGSETTKVIHKFAIGTAGLTRTVQQQLLSESETYNDLLLIDSLEDSYRNLTKKLLLSFASISMSHSFHYLLKCDDDTYVKLDIMLANLLDYHHKISMVDYGVNPSPQLYWGYFNGNANVKTHGQWKETHFNLCTKYLPYALGGGYVITRELVQYVHTNGDILTTYTSEDISLGVWFASMRNVYRKHDCRFDTAYMARTCKDYHMVLHKRSAEDMMGIFKGTECSEKQSDDNVKRPMEYLYNWKAAPVHCCDTLVD